MSPDSQSSCISRGGFSYRQTPALARRLATSFSVQLQRHPFADGKPSVKVLQSFGPSERLVWKTTTARRAGIPKMLPKEQFKAIEALVDGGATIDDTREDLRVLPLVVSTLQTRSTSTMRSARAAGQRLVADSGDCRSHNLPQRSRGPHNLDCHSWHVALLPWFGDTHAARGVGSKRNLEARGRQKCRGLSAEHLPRRRHHQLDIQLAVVQSKAKLSYQEVEEVLTNGTEHEFADTLKHLNDCYSALRTWRESRELVIEHRPEHRWLLNENKQIDRIEEVQKKTSQLLVEECMVAANRCIAQALKDAELPGPFVTHAGIRRDRVEEAKEFLTRFLPDQNTLDFSTLDGFRTLINELNAATGERPLRSMINRLMSRASFSVKPHPHGRGIACLHQWNVTPTQSARLLRAPPLSHAGRHKC